MLHPDGTPVGAWAWPLERRLAYAEDRAERLIDRHPGIAEAWLREVDRLRLLMQANVVPAAEAGKEQG